MFDTISAFLLAFVVAWTAINYAVNKTVESGLVLAGFMLLLLSHVFFIFTPLMIWFYFSAHLIQLLALCLVITAILRARRT